VSELVERLREQAQEIAAANHYGWGNTMQEAANRIEELERRVRYYEFQNDADKIMTNQKQRIEELEREVAELRRSGGEPKLLGHQCEHCGGTGIEP
jgi:polyhydroxyalkanoate synthesis regulator phasin